MIKDISFFSLVYGIFTCRNIHNIVDSLERRHKTANFKASIPFSKRKIYILQDREYVQGVLKKKSTLPFVNLNFDISHGHFLSINSFNTSNQLWEDLHHEMLTIFNNTPISPIMEKHKGLLVETPKYIVNDQLEEFFLRVWSEYSFGPCDFKQYAEMRNLLIINLNKSFHQNSFNRLPLLGKLTSKINYIRHGGEIKRVNECLKIFLNKAINNQQGVFYALYEKLQAKYKNAFDITFDNAYLGVLVYDFIYTVMLDFTVNIAQLPKPDIISPDLLSYGRKVQLQKSMHQGFLYPFRFRIMAEDHEDINEGDYCVLNLQKSGLYFSAASRACPGAKLFKEISNTLLEIYSAIDVSMVNSSTKITYDNNRDIPLMTSRHEIYQCPFKHDTKATDFAEEINGDLQSLYRHHNATKSV